MYVYVPYNERVLSALFERHTHEKDGVVVLTGLTSKLCGTLLKVKRYEEEKRAVIVAVPLDERVHTPVEIEAVKAAARLLHERASRTLVGWTVEGLGE